MAFLQNSVLAFALQLILALIFATAAISKMRSWEGFVGVVQDYQILPPVLVRPVARVLPPVELLVALGLLIPATRVVAALVAAVLLVIFSAAIGINVARDRLDIDCGCFQSALEHRLSWWLVLRNGLLTALALVCILPSLDRDLYWLHVVAVVGGALLLFLLYLVVRLVRVNRRES